MLSRGADATRGTLSEIAHRMDEYLRVVQAHVQLVFSSAVCG